MHTKMFHCETEPCTQFIVLFLAFIFYWADNLNYLLMAECTSVEEMMDDVANRFIAWKTSGRLAQMSYLALREEANKSYLNIIGETNTDSHFQSVHYVGSYHGEGMPEFVCGDKDMMGVFPTFPIVCWKRLSTKCQETGYVVGEQIKDDPAYLKLRVMDETCLHKDYQCFVNNGYLKSSDFMEKRLEFMKEYSSAFEIHGPSVTIPSGHQVPHTLKYEPMNDIVFCLLCQSWPSINYFTRKRQTNWPSEKLLQKISDVDCHIVAVGRPNSLSKMNEWRLSFSLAEKILFREIPEQFANCLFALKAIKKKHKLYESREQKPLCSYFIKTACLWICERMSCGNTMNLIRSVLDWLINCYENRHMPHYFIPEQNLIGHLSKESCDDVRTTLTTIKKHLWTEVMSSIEGGIVDSRRIINKHICDALTIERIGQSHDYAMLEVNLLKHPTATTRCLKGVVNDLKNSITDHMVFEINRWVSCSILPFDKAVIYWIRNSTNIAEIVSNIEGLILPIIKKLKEIVIEGYEDIFKAKLHRHIGDLLTSTLVCLRDKYSYEDRTKYQNKALQYYKLGAEMIYPDGLCDDGVGHEAYVVKFHYLMGNHKELKDAIDDFRNAFRSFEDYKLKCIPFINIHTGDEREDLTYREWEVDKSFQCFIKNQSNTDFSFSLIPIVYYIYFRVRLNDGNVECASKIATLIENLKEHVYTSDIELLLGNFAECLIGLVKVMQMICNGTIYLIR
ncbi:uncharacterized protein [Antedon mediterranea]|uniref:uncharacterized protein n=1 Tax=Antedon mediterranea TaxID=105859 RepID=UPI003AF84571